MNIRATSAASALAICALLWLGLLLGVSFLATPAKFLAPGLTLPVGLEVGRYTFSILSHVEAVAAVVVLLCAALGRLGRTVLLAASIPALLVAVQALWLLPLLDARVELILQDNVPEPGAYHSLSVGLEVIKAAALTVLAALSFPDRGAEHPASRVEQPSLR